MSASIESENRCKVQLWISEFLNRNLDLDSHEKTFDPMIIFYATKACQDEKWYWKMQEYHLRLAFYLSKAETVLRIQTKEMENLTSCYYVAPKSNIFVQYIPLVRFLVFYALLRTGHRYKGLNWNLVMRFFSSCCISLGWHQSCSGLFLDLFQKWFAEEKKTK